MLHRSRGPDFDPSPESRSAPWHSPASHTSLAAVCGAPVPPAAPCIHDLCGALAQIPRSNTGHCLSSQVLNVLGSGFARLMLLPWVRCGPHAVVYVTCANRFPPTAPWFLLIYHPKHIASGGR